MKENTTPIALHSGFHNSFIDFNHGIRVGKLDVSQRITQIVKAILIERHGIDVVCDRWGRGVYWQWICWVPRPNREAKPLSSDANFSSVKFFIAVDREQRRFQSGFQLERAPKRAGSDGWGIQLQKDWDWNVLLGTLTKGKLSRYIRELLGDGFIVRAGPFTSMTEYTDENWSDAACLRAIKRKAADEWGVFQLFWPTLEAEVREMSGIDLIESMAAVFDEVAPAMNECMYLPCLNTTHRK